MNQEINTQVELVTTAETMQRLLDDLRSSTVISLDVEATAKHKWYQPEYRLLTIAITTRAGHAYVIPCEHDQSFTDGVAVFKRLWKNLPAPPKIVMQAGTYDYLALMSRGIDIGLDWLDTLVAEYLIDVDRKKSLVALAQRYLGLADWKDIDYSAPEDEDLDMLARLNGRDTDVTYRLLGPLIDEMQRLDLGTLYFKLMMPAVYRLTRMELDGIPVDEDRLRHLEAETSDVLEEILTSLEEEAEQWGPWPMNKNRKAKVFNPGSFKQVGRVLYEILELPVPDFTDTGAPSTNADALRKIQHMHPFVKRVQEYREVKKFHSSSLVPWLERLTNGKLHPHYKPTETRTGRLSSELPNIQQVPPKGRVVFGGVSGHKVVEIDYSQLELRIVAELAQEWTMLDAFHKGEDLHQITADLLEVDRAKGKTANFGLLYGGGPRVLQREALKVGLKLTELEAEYIRTRWFETYADIEEFHKRTLEDAHLLKGIKSLIGRWRPLPDLASQEWKKRGAAERQAINMPVQSLASDITLFQLSRIDLTILGRPLGRPIATVHDSILFLMPDSEYIVDDIRLIQDELEDLDTFNSTFGVDIQVPLVTDYKIGDYWA